MVTNEIYTMDVTLRPDDPMAEIDWLSMLNDPNIRLKIESALLYGEVDPCSNANDIEQLDVVHADNIEIRIHWASVSVSHKLGIAGWENGPLQILVGVEIMPNRMLDTMLSMGFPVEGIEIRPRIVGHKLITFDAYVPSNWKSF